MDPRPARVAGGRRSGVDAAPVAPEQPGSGQAEGGPEQRIADQRGDHETLGQGFRRQAGMDLGLRRAEQVRQRQQDGADQLQRPVAAEHQQGQAHRGGGGGGDPPVLALHQVGRGGTRQPGGRPSDGARQNTA